MITQTDFMIMRISRALFRTRLRAPSSLHPRTFLAPPSHLPLNCPCRYLCTPTNKPSFASLVGNIESGWTPPKNLKNQELYPIPPTSEWTLKELEFFRLHYYQVTDQPILNTIFCDNAPLTPEAEDIINMPLLYPAIVEGMLHLISSCDFISFIVGNYRYLPLPQRLFAGLLYSAINPQRTEAISDHLIRLLLEMCNPDNVLVTEPQNQKFETQVSFTLSSFFLFSHLSSLLVFEKQLGWKIQVC